MEKDSFAFSGSLVAVVGAMIFASDEPVRSEEIRAALGDVSAPDVEAAIDDLERHYERCDVGLRLERVGGGVRLATRAEVGSSVRRMFQFRHRTRLSPAALETLAIVAYRQPVTAPEIQAIRGKDPEAALKGLLERKLVRCLGRKKVVGSPLLYGTSRDFLVHFGLNDLDDLPSIEEFEPFLAGLEAQAGAGSEEARAAAPAAPPPPDLGPDAS